MESNTVTVMFVIIAFKLTICWQLAFYLFIFVRVGIGSLTFYLFIFVHVRHLSISSVTRNILPR